MPRSNPFDYFFILRPLILIPSWNFLLIGSYFGAGQGRFTYDITLGLIIYTMAAGGVYILNQIMDVDTDRVNEKLFLISGSFVRTRAAYIEMAILWAGAIFLSIRFGWLFSVLVIASILLGTLYSVPPFKFKGKPIIDTLANGVGYGIINFAIGWLLVKEFDFHILARFLPYFLSICAVFINTTIVDIDGDRKTGDLTTGVFLGPTLSHVISTLLMAGAIVAAYIRRDYICLIPAVLSWPLFLFAAVHALSASTVHRKVTIASFRLPGLLFTIVTGVLYPLYFAALIVLFVGMRVYYRRRFNVNYPTLYGG
ncbi:MAG: UbiA family prenyltransferase [candidate division WOR-3 bacterium]|nr:MAG: UbiA family prenyltransferase [candidate division WOR-3 bacterium]